MRTHELERSLIRLRCGKIVRTGALDGAERNRNGAGVDGPDPETNIDGPRLRVSVNPRSLTAAAARNARMDHANGEWIAFLDDDDEWLPKKLAKQMAYAADRGPVLVTCLSRVVTPAVSFIRPASDLREPSSDRRISVRSPLTMIVTYQPRGRRPLARA